MCLIECASLQAKALLEVKPQLDAAGVSLMALSVGMFPIFLCDACSMLVSALMRLAPSM